MARLRTTNKHLPKYVTVVHGSYWYRAPKTKAVRIAAVGEEQALYKFMAEKAAPVGPITTMNDLFDRYQREVVPTLAERTQKDYHGIIAKLRGVFGDMKPNDIEPRDVGRYLDVPKGKISANRQIAVLSAVFTKAVGRWYVADRNPCFKVERNKKKARDRYVTDEEYKAVYAMMPARHQIAMELALLTGQRQGDLLRLEWEQINEKEGRIYFRQGKTGKQLRVRISPRLQAAIDRAKLLIPHLPRQYVLRTAKGQRFKSSGFKSVWQRYMRRAYKGYSKKAHRGAEAVQYPPVIRAPFTFHDLRAKSVSDAKSLQDAYERAGHTSMAMTRGVYDRGIRDVEPLE